LRDAIWLARLTLYLGLFVGVGGAFYSSWIAAVRPSGWTGAIITGAIQGALIAALMSVGLHGVDVQGLSARAFARPRSGEAVLQPPMG
jgi:copper transport protein